MKRIGLSLIVLMFSLFSFAQSDILGTWKTIDDETNKEKSYVEIFEKNNKYYGKIVKIIDPNKQDAKCKDCEGRHKNQPVMGLEMLWDLELDADDKEFDETILVYSE